MDTINLQYARRAWSDLLADDETKKTLLVLALLSLIPVFGAFITTGYLMQWARDAAWKVNRPLSFKNIRFGLALKSGFCSVLALFCWNLVILATWSIVSSMPFSGTLFIILFPSCCAVETVVLLMVFRAVIYDNIEPVIQVPQAFNMALENPVGLLQILLLGLLTLIPQILGSGVCVLIASAFKYVETYPSIAVIAMVVPAVLVLALLYGMLNVTALALVLRALGHWTSEFAPETWGQSREKVSRRG